MIEDYQKIAESFGPQKYFGKAHILRTAEEGLETLFYVQLKPKYPNNKHVQVAALWRIYQMHDDSVQYLGETDSELQESFRKGFQYIVDLWPPAPIKNSDIDMVLSRIVECNHSIESDPKRSCWYSGPQVGYYLNKKRMGSTFPSEVVAEIKSAKEGYVLYKDWNDLMAIFVIKNVYTLFYWGHGA